MKEMTPKEKANDLLWKFLPIYEGWKYEDSKIAIQCSIIVVDELLQYGNLYSSKDQMERDVIEDRTEEFWENVRKELEAL